MNGAIDTSMIDWSRAQFALTAMYHWLFVPLTLGLAVIMGTMETIYYRTGNEFWKRTAKFWMKLFGVNFAIGVATGLILEFQFVRCSACYRRHSGILHGGHIYCGNVFRLGEGEPQVPSCFHMAYWPWSYYIGMVDIGCQFVDAVSSRNGIQS